MAVAISKEEIFYLRAGEHLTSDKLVSLLADCGAASYATLDLKPQVALLGLSDCKENGGLKKDSLFDAVIAAYLINPAKNEYEYEDIAPIFQALDSDNIIISTVARIIMRASESATEKEIYKVITEYLKRNV